LERSECLSQAVTRHEKLDSLEYTTNVEDPRIAISQTHVDERAMFLFFPLVFNIEGALNGTTRNYQLGFFRIIPDGY
jgi:hypothetical protein